VAIVSILGALVGLGFAVGILLVIDGLQSRLRPTRNASRSKGSVVESRRLARAAAAALVTLIVSRWPVAAAGAAGLAWFTPELFGSKDAEERAIARTEGIASWTEMLRDTLAGAHGLEEAITTTAAVAPDAIKLEVTTLAIRLERQPLTRALDAFGVDLAHPMGDLVVTALRLAAAGSVGELNELLGTLAVAARDEASLRLRVEASRARLRTAVRVIAACTAATALGLIVLNRRYLDVYASALGQVVLGVVVVCWGISLSWLSRMGRLVVPERFLASADTEVAAP
jgi:hypothetical protein